MAISASTGIDAGCGGEGDRPLIRPLRGHLLPQGEKESRGDSADFAICACLPLSRFHRAKAGYTLTEMLVVISIIGLIAAVLTPAVMSQMARARAKTAEVQIDTLGASMEMFYADVGRYPTDQEGLAALVDEPAGTQGWKGPYVKNRRKLNDPWGQPISYKLSPGAHKYVLTSLGQDGEPGGQGVNADIVGPDEGQ